MDIESFSVPPLAKACTQNEELSVIRMQLFIVMQGIYFEARRVYDQEYDKGFMIKSMIRIM
jgi:hypothetical protein